MVLTHSAAGVDELVINVAPTTLPYGLDAAGGDLVELTNTVSAEKNVLN